MIFLLRVKADKNYSLEFLVKLLHKASNGCSLVLIRADEEIKFTSVLWRFFVPKKKVHNVFFVTIELGSCHFYIVACTAPMRTATSTYRDERANGDGDR